MTKLWGGRFSESTDELIQRLNNSLPFDSRLWREDILGSIAHATMLGEQRIIPLNESDRIVAGLKAIESGLADGSLELDPAQEDIHSAIEALLHTEIGPVAGKLHTARSRNDQVATDLRFYLRGVIDQIDDQIRSVQQSLLLLAAKELGLRRSSRSRVADATAEDGVDPLTTDTITQPPTILPGYTHLQHAQPVLLSHHLLAYFWMLRRDRERLADCRSRVNKLPLGSAALAGTGFPIDRDGVAEIMGFDGICENSMDAVSDRDFVIEFLAAAALIMVHLSRFAEELILWNSPEFGYVELADSVTTGSSIMPQKKNPDVAELTRGKTGRVIGDLVTLLTVMKGLPLAYNKDMQEDKEPLFDAVDTLLLVLPAFEKMLATASFKRERMLAATHGDFSTATDLADHLVRQGMPFREAHHVVGRIVRSCIERGIGLEELDPALLKELAPEIGDVALLTVEASVNSRRSTGGTALEAVREQLEMARKLLQ